MRHPQLLFQTALCGWVQAQVLGERATWGPAQLSALLLSRARWNQRLLAAIPPGGRTCREPWGGSPMLALRLICIRALQTPACACLSHGSYKEACFICLNVFGLVFVNAGIAICVSDILGFFFQFSLFWQQTPPCGAKGDSLAFVT